MDQNGKKPEICLKLIAIASIISFAAAILILLSIFFIYKQCRKQQQQQQLNPEFVPNDDQESENYEAEEQWPRPDMTGHGFPGQSVVWVDTRRTGLTTMTSTSEDLTTRCISPTLTLTLEDLTVNQNTTEANCYNNEAMPKSSELLLSESGFVDSFRDWKVQQHLKIHKRRMEKREKTLQKILTETTLQEQSFNTQPLVFQKKNPIVNTKSCSCKHIRVCRGKPRKQPSRC